MKETTSEYSTKTGETRHKKLLAGRGKLTEEVIGKLTDYYGYAIRRNADKTVEEMRRDIMSPFYHCISTDKEPKHFLCPEGEQSWCFYQKAIAMNKKKEEEKQKKKDMIEEELGGESDSSSFFYGGKRPTAKKVEIPSHSTMKVYFTVGTEEQQKIRDVYKRLSDVELLQKCLQGKTPNPNESLHNRI